jgi:hypothetical protein
LNWQTKSGKQQKQQGTMNGFIIPQAIDNLPRLIRRLLPGQGIEDDWDKFTDTVKEIPLRKIKEVLEDEKQNEEVTNTVARLLAETTLQNQDQTPTAGCYTNQAYT